ncbi:hypothetical protein EDD16DRAFT_1438712, partial [Pisolithus croceorrhizus]
ELARVLGIHRNTLRHYMKNHGLERRYTDITDTDLDHLVTEFKKRRPESGIRYIIGFLRKHGLRIQ